MRNLKPGMKPPVLSAYDIVVINAGYREPEVAGKRGYVVGLAESDQIGVFVYDVARVWCLHPDDVVATGERDGSAQARRGAPLRVGRSGDVLD